MGWLLDFINHFWQLLKDIFIWSFKAIEYIGEEIAKNLFAGFFTLAGGVINALDVGTILTEVSSAWGLLDPQVAWFMVNLGVSQGLGILGIAFGIRFLLNLIPAAFTRV